MPADQLPVKRVGPFRLIEPLGRGRTSRVYLAQRDGLDRMFALKLLDAGLDPDTVLRSERGAQVAANLNHPGIVRAVEMGRHEGRLYLVMERVPGETLAERLEVRGVFLWGDAARLVTQVAEAVGFAHSKGVIHRDLKATNIIIDSRDGLPRVLDFGLARDLRSGQSITQRGAFLGTPAVMAPEQVRGEKADARSDVYSLGVLLYELMSGRSPFTAKSLDALCGQILGSSFEPLRSVVPDVPRELDALVSRAMHADPARRPKDANRLAELLREIWSPSRGGFSSLRVVLGQPSPALWILLLITCAALCGTTTWGAWERRKGAIAALRLNKARRESDAAHAQRARMTEELARAEERAERAQARRTDLAADLGRQEARSEEALAKVVSLEAELIKAQKTIGAGSAQVWAAGEVSKILDWMIGELDRDPDPVVLRAHLLHSRGRWDECLEVVQQARVVGQPDPYLLVLEARIHMIRNRTAHAQRALKEILQHASAGSPERLFAETLTLGAGSTARLAEAGDSAPHAGYLQILRSNMLMQQGLQTRNGSLLRESVRAADLAVRLDPGSFQVFFQRSLARYNMWAATGRKDSSLGALVISDLQRARELKPDPTYWLWGGKSYLEMLGQARSAIPELMEAKRRADAEGMLEIRLSARGLLGVAHLALGDEDAAGREWLDAIRIAPRNQLTYNGFLGALPRASAALRTKVLSAVPKDVRPQLERALRGKR